VRRRTRRLLALAVLLVTLGSAATPAAAKAIPLPPLPTPTVPPQLTPALKLVAPIAAPECANLGLTAALILPALAGDIPGGSPVDPTPLFAPILAICGAVPQPGEELTCQADATIAALASKGISSVIGSEGGLLAKVLDLSLFGQITEEVYVLQTVTPQQIQSLNLEGMLYNALKCTKLGSTGPELGTGPATLPAAGPPAPLVGTITEPSTSLVPEAPITSSGTYTPSLGASPVGATTTPGTTSTPSTVPLPTHAQSLPPSPGTVNTAFSPTATLAQGGALVGVLILVAAGVAVLLHQRRVGAAALTTERIDTTGSPDSPSSPS